MNARSTRLLSDWQSPQRASMPIGRAAASFVLVLLASLMGALPAYARDHGPHARWMQQERVDRADRVERNADAGQGVDRYRQIDSADDGRQYRRMSQDERRRLRRDLRDAGRDIYQDQDRRYPLRDFREH